MALSYTIKLPIPTSVNNSHGVGPNRKGGHIIRSDAYKNWLLDAAVVYRNTFPGGVIYLKGRLRVDYVFCFNPKQLPLSDVDNRIKCLNDFLQHKFFENDKQIDDIHAYRRATKEASSFVIARIAEIADRRYDDPLLLF